MNIRTKNKRGFILLMVMAIMAALAALLGGYIVVSVYYNSITSKYGDGIRAYYLASSAAKSYMTCIAENYYKTRTALYAADLTPCDLSVTGAGDTINITRQAAGDVIRVTSAAAIGGVSKTLTMELENNDVIIDKYFNTTVPMPDYDFYQDGLPVVKWEIQ